MTIISKDTKIPLGFLWTIIGLLLSGVGFIVHLETTLTTLEVQLHSHMENPSIHEQKFKELESRVSINKEILDEIKSMNDRLLQIEQKVNP